jgi:hypothetical protein
MRAALKGFLLAVPAIVTASVAATAQSTSTPAPRGGFGGWVYGHPYVDLVAALAIIAIIAGAYFRHQRSRG